MAGRIASASIRAVVGSKRPIKAALTLVSKRLNSIVSINYIMYYVFLQTPSAVDQLKKILSGKTDCVSYAFIVYAYTFILIIIFPILNMTDWS